MSRVTRKQKKGRRARGPATSLTQAMPGSNELNRSDAEAPRRLYPDRMLVGAR